jgi:hypothetical protein
MKRNFEEFKGRAIPASSRMMRVAIQRRGTMSFNHATFEALGKPEALTLYYDEDTKAVAFKAASKKVRHAYPVRKQPHSNSYLIAAQAFCTYYNIDISASRAFTPNMEDGMLVFELDKGTVVSPRVRSSKKPPKK